MQLNKQTNKQTNKKVYVRGVVEYYFTISGYPKVLSYINLMMNDLFLFNFSLTIFKILFVNAQFFFFSLRTYSFKFITSLKFVFKISSYHHINNYSIFYNIY